MCHSRNTKQLNWPEQAGLRLLYVDKKAQRSQTVQLKRGLQLRVARCIKQCMNSKYLDLTMSSHGPFLELDAHIHWNLKKKKQNK